MHDDDDPLGLARAHSDFGGAAAEMPNRELTPEEMRAKYGWASPEERERAYAEVALREARLEATRIIMAGPCPEARQAPPVTSEAGLPKQPAAASMAREWQSYIKGRIRKSEELMVQVVGQVLGEHRLAHDAELAELKRELEAVREQVRALELEVAEVRGEIGTRRSEVPAKPLRSVG